MTYTWHFMVSLWPLFLDPFGCITYILQRMLECSFPAQTQELTVSYRTNQTTLEHLSPFLLLRQLPPLPPQSSSGRKLSDPPLEHELSYPQRRLVRDAHSHIRIYDVGWRRNWGQVMGWDRPWGWVYRIAVGGGGCALHFGSCRSCGELTCNMLSGCSKGDGRAFPRNPRADDMLARLAVELVNIDKDQ